MDLHISMNMAVVEEIRRWLGLTFDLAGVCLLAWIGFSIIRLRQILAGTQQEMRRAIHALKVEIAAMNTERPIPPRGHLGSASRPAAASSALMTRSSSGVPREPRSTASR